MTRSCRGGVLALGWVLASSGDVGSVLGGSLMGLSSLGVMGGGYCVSISLGGSFGTGGGRLGSDVSFGLMAEVVGGVCLSVPWEVVCDDPPRQWLSGRGVAPEEPLVSQCQSARSVHPYVVLVESPHFNHYAGPVPFGGEVSRLVLHPDMGANPQWWKGSCMFSPSFRCQGIAVAKCLFPFVPVVPPCCMWDVLARQ